MLNESIPILVCLSISIADIFEYENFKDFSPHFNTLCTV